MNRTLSLLIAANLSLSHVIAGGSVEWTFHALPILKKRPDLLRIISTSLEVAPTGSGFRLGKDAEAEQGKRIPPYEFPARLKGSSGKFDLLLIIHAASGSHEDGDDDTWIEIRPKKPA